MSQPNKFSYSPGKAPLYTSQTEKMEIQNQPQFPQNSGNQNININPNQPWNNAFASGNNFQEGYHQNESLPKKEFKYTANDQNQYPGNAGAANLFESGKYQVATGYQPRPLDPSKESTLTPTQKHQSSVVENVGQPALPFSNI